MHVLFQRRSFSTSTFPIQQMKSHLQHFFQTTPSIEFLNRVQQVDFSFERNSNEYHHFISPHSPYLYLTSHHIPSNTVTKLKQQASETSDSTEAKHAVLLLLYQNLQHSLVALLLKKSALQAKNPNYIHANQLALPGGNKNKEESLEECALRETVEEVNFLNGPQYQQYEIINTTMSPFSTYSGRGASIVKPFIGTMKYEHEFYEFNLQKNEIAEAYEIPLARLISSLNENGKTLARKLDNNNHIYYHGVTFTLADVPSIEQEQSTIEIWGFTARLLSYFFAVLYKHTI